MGPADNVMVFVALASIILLIAISIAFCRWIFRINVIVDALESIGKKLDTLIKQNAPPSQ